MRSLLIIIGITVLIASAVLGNLLVLLAGVALTWAGLAL